MHALYSHKSYSRFTLDTQAQLTAKAPGTRLEPGAMAATVVGEAHARAPHEPLCWRYRTTFRTRIHRSGRSDIFCHDVGARPFRSQRVSRSTRRGLGLRLASAVPLRRLPRTRTGLRRRRKRPPRRCARSFARALGQSGRQRLHFYCTTEQLTVQYQRLGVAAFGTLPYPVHELFRPRQTLEWQGRTAPHRLPRPQPTRKGLRTTARIILRSLWTGWFAPGRAQLVLQTRHLGLATGPGDADPNALGDTAGSVAGTGLCRISLAAGRLCAAPVQRRCGTHAL